MGNSFFGAHKPEIVFGSNYLDSFGRMRVSTPETLFDSKQLLDKSPLLWDDQEVSGSGTGSSWSAAKASTTLSVGVNTAGRRVRQTFRRFNYQPGKSQQILLTGTLGQSGGGSGIQRCAGIYDDNNGILFRDNEGVVEAVVRSKTTGSVVDNAIPQSSWNLDKLDGNGPSGVTLDPEKSQIICIDYEWLSVGVVRAGFVIDGIIVYAHQFLHANIAQGAYMTTPNLPIRFEIINDGTGAASELEQICASVISEGGHNPIGLPQYASTEGTHIDANAADSLYAVLGIRQKAASIIAGGGAMKVDGISLIAETNDDFEWILYHNPTVAGTFTYSDKSNSAMQVAKGVTANTITGGHPIDGGFSKAEGNVTVKLSSSLSLGSAIDGTPDELVLCVRPLSANADIQGILKWTEF